MKRVTVRRLTSSCKDTIKVYCCKQSVKPVWWSLERVLDATLLSREEWNGRVHRAFARISPNYPENFLCDFLLNFHPPRSWRHFGMTSKKRSSCVFLQTFGAIVPGFSDILLRFLTNQNFWGCACTPASYTVVYNQQFCFSHWCKSRWLLVGWSLPEKVGKHWYSRSA